MTPARCPLCDAATIAPHCNLSRFEVYRCDACTLRFRHPLPGRDEMRAMYEDERYHESAYFENARAGYRQSSPEIRIYRRALDDLAMFAPPGRLLDVGCATGVFLDLARAVGWTVCGAELSARHAAYARETFGLDVWEGDFGDAPYPPGSFDAITMWDFLEHVLDPIAVLAQARRLLAPGGTLLVFTIDTASLFNRMGDLLHRILGTRATPVLELLYDARHNYYFTREALRRVLVRSGFRIDRWRADRAYLGRWLAEPASPVVVAGGYLIDLASGPLGLPYRRTAICRIA